MTELEELVALFAGEYDELGVVTTPWPSVTLALEICRVVRPQTLTMLRKSVFGEVPLDEIDLEQRRSLSSAFAQWQTRQRIAIASALG